MGVVRATNNPNHVDRSIDIPGPGEVVTIMGSLVGAHKGPVTTEVALFVRPLLDLLSGIVKVGKLMTLFLQLLAATGTSKNENNSRRRNKSQVIRKERKGKERKRKRGKEGRSTLLGREPLGGFNTAEQPHEGLLGGLEGRGGAALEA